MNDRKKKQWLMPVIGVILVCVLGVGVYLAGQSEGLAGRLRQSEEAIEENRERYGYEKPTEIFVGDTNLAEYQIVLQGGDKKAKEAAKLLQRYIREIAGCELSIVSKETETPSIRIVTEKTVEGDEENIDITNGIITIRGADGQDCLDKVSLFANQYLGWAFAGEAREHILEHIGELYITDNTYSTDGEAWMPQREPIICLWKTNVPRGEFYNPNASLKSELLSYSDDQLYTYVKMMKYCGFTGIQVTDMCSAWAAYGSYQYVQSRLRYLADVAHSLDMKFTLWVWAAEFNGYGWVDNDISYYDREISDYAFENPKAVATFDKYYDIYAQLADCADRIILHFNDPGNLMTQEDICYFSEMLRDKVKAIHPAIDFGVSCYTDEIDKNMLVDRLGNDITIYGNASHTELENVTAFRQNCANMGVRLGIWSWNLVEYEIDQFAQMNVNADVIKSVYELSAGYDEIAKPEYWSEMDSYHMINIFSLYCAGRLLIDPSQDADVLLQEIARDVVGEANAEALYEILKLVEDARSGKTWDTFHWKNEDYLLRSDSYDAQDILERCETCIPKLEEMIETGTCENRIPLAISGTDLLQMIQPHLEQLKKFAEFRIDLAEAEELLSAGAEEGTLQEKVNALYVPIPEYNCLTGVWGQTEARTEWSMLEEFCKKAQVQMPEDPVLDYYRKQRIYQEFCCMQKGKENRCSFDKQYSFQWGMGFSGEVILRLCNELVEEGLLTETEDGRVYLTDWENYRYHF